MNYLYILATLCLFGACYCQETKQNVTKCYVYEDDTVDGKPKNPFEESPSKSTICDDLQRSDGSSDFSLRKEISRAFTNEKGVKSYRCLYMIATSEGQTKEYRTCGIYVPTISSACEYLKQELSTDVQLKDCKECDSNNCNGVKYGAGSTGGPNGADHLTASIFMGVGALFLYILY